MHSSFFNYSIIRPYPYKWFTPVAIVGLLVLAVLLSVLNFVQNSYTLVVQYSNDPNSTIREGIWFNHWPSYLTSSVRPTCQPANLPVNSLVFTNQSGLAWTITSIYQNDESTVALPSLPYMNNIISGCVIPMVQMELDGSQDQDVSNLEHTQWNVQVRAFITCHIYGPIGPMMFNATALYDGIAPYTIPGSTVFVARDPIARSAMFWAESLLSAYWTQLSTTTWTVAEAMKPTISKGVVTLTPSGNNNITSLDFFEMTYYFLTPSASSGMYFGGASDPPQTLGHMIQLGDSAQAKPPIWQPVDSLAKSMYSAVLADLGQTFAPPESNILSTAERLQSFTADFHEIEQNSTVYFFSQLESESYDARQAGPNPTGPLDLTASVIATNYLCQVPQRKPLGDIVIAVLLADLVLLQAAWKLYTFAVRSALFQKHPSAKRCLGCLDETPSLESPRESDHSATKRSLKSCVVVSTLPSTHSERRASQVGGRRWKWNVFARAD
ncbi:hypothetical protein BDY17DRAFT_310121 [Neohortaea acidophila]|uniref:Transmembrane protein n=1 Tax=Neohortaea acidophila TaxID=245834 RepID=A0A6A6PT35_9PEZI|nr:uncharacterized protein BDY17DRAFT_310121 [Neohortaea acidophila]KAF2483045.1 hypothetical protein BDY17DRAFT_310121 [Neohortaea acidophila]